VDVTRWLNEIGLPQYIELFRAHNIDADVLSSLTVEDLKEARAFLDGLSQ
jgi:hypothetical protein